MLNDFYRTQQWRQLRKQLMLDRVEADGFLYCEHCRKPITRASSCIVHHKEPLTLENMRDWDIAYNPDNLALVHARCHNAIHERFGNGWTQKVYIVYGAPCSGKTSYVLENMTDKDIIIDMDRLYSAIGSGRMYDKPTEIKDVIFHARNALYEAVQQRLGNWRTAWVVATLPYAKDRELLAERLGAELVYIQTNKDICMQRLYESEERQAVANEWARFIDDWFIDYIPGENDAEIDGNAGSYAGDMPPDCEEIF